MSTPLGRMNSTKWKTIAPVAILIVFSVLAAILVATSTPVASGTAPRTLRAVRVAEVAVETLQLEVLSQGTVAPRTESELIPEVSGPVIWTSPSLANGATFADNELLLRIDARDYQAAVERAHAALERARAEDEHAQSELSRQQTLATRGVASDSELDAKRRLARISSASLREAQLTLEQSERDLTRTEIRAPFAGRVREEHADLGQFLNRGNPFAVVYATDLVEIRLPIPDHQLAYLTALTNAPTDGAVADLPDVKLTGYYAGTQHTWEGTIVRAEGELDARTRLVHVVARVENPESIATAAGTQTATAPGVIAMPVGLFVEARIAGRTARDVVVLPRSALQDSNRVLVMDAQNRLHYREIEVLRLHRDRVVVRSGLAAGERVCVSALEAIVEGMEVEPVLVGANGPDTSHRAAARAGRFAS